MTALVRRLAVAALTLRVLILAARIRAKSRTTAMSRAPGTSESTESEKPARAVNDALRRFSEARDPRSADPEWCLYRVLLDDACRRGMRGEGRAA